MVLMRIRYLVTVGIHARQVGQPEAVWWIGVQVPGRRGD